MKRSAGGVFLALVFLLSVWGSAFGEMNPMVAESIATIETQLGQIPSDGGGKRIGVLVITLSNPYWTEMKKRYEEWASEMNVSVEILAADWAELPLDDWGADLPINWMDAGKEAVEDDAK